MKTDVAAGAWLFRASIWVLVVVCVVLSSGPARAEYDYNVSQISPIPLTIDQVDAILNENQAEIGTPYLDAYQQKTTDTTGASLGLSPLKVVQADDPDHPYLGVFHHKVTPGKFATYAAYSADLVNWHTLGIIDDVGAGEYASG